MKERPQPMSPEEEKKWARQRCAELIAENMEDESEVIKKYLPLLFNLENNGFKKAAVSIREIISDAKNHLLILQGLLLEFDGDIPVAFNDANEALKKIKNALKDDQNEE